MPDENLSRLWEEHTNHEFTTRDTEATLATMGLIELMPGLRPLDAGSLSQASAIEAFTAVCITLNIRHKAHSTLRIAGI